MRCFVGISPNLRQVAHYQYVGSGRNAGDDFKRFVEDHRVKCHADDAFRRFLENQRLITLFIIANYYNRLFARAVLCK